MHSAVLLLQVRTSIIKKWKMVEDESNVDPSELKYSDQNKGGKRQLHHRPHGATPIAFRVFFFTLLLFIFWTSRGRRCHPFFPRFLHSFFFAHRVQQSHCSSIVHRVLLTNALVLSASRFVHKKNSPRIYMSMHSGDSNSRN